MTIVQTALILAGFALAGAGLAGIKFGSNAWWMLLIALLCFGGAYLLGK